MKVLIVNAWCGYLLSLNNRKPRSKVKTTSCFTTSKNNGHWSIAGSSIIEYYSISSRHPLQCCAQITLKLFG